MRWSWPPRESPRSRSTTGPSWDRRCCGSAVACCAGAWPICCCVAAADQLMATLAATPDGVLVSAETVKDYQLTLGDSLQLRVQDTAGGGPVTATFHYVGVANEFPTAPKDSFLVANADYLAKVTGND